MTTKVKDELRATIVGRIDMLEKSELTVKEQLAMAAREILEHYTLHSDGTLAVRLISVLTPMNKAAAIGFFNHFLMITETGAKVGSDKARAKVDTARAEWLAGSETFWEFVAAEVETPTKPVDLKAELVKAVKRALHGIHTTKRDQEGLKKAEIAVAIMGEISLDELMQAVIVGTDLSGEKVVEMPAAEEVTVDEVEPVKEAA